MKRSAFAGLLVACATTPQARAAVFDLNADWSNISNPNGVWTLREGSNPLPLLSQWIVGPQPAWARSRTGNTHVPGFFKALVPKPGSFAYTDWQLGDVVVHTTDPGSGAGAGHANVLFTVPTSGLATISGDIWNSSSFNRPQNWFLYHNGTALLASGGLPGSGVNGRNARDLFSISNFSVEAGDTLELRTVRNHPAGDFLGLNFNVYLASAVPEPTSWALMIAGFGLVGSAMRRRTKTRVTYA